MYYKSMYCTHSVENNFKNNLRNTKKEAETFTNLKTTTTVTTKLKKPFTNFCQVSSRAFEKTNRPLDNSDAKKKYMFTVEKLKSNIEMFNTNSKKLKKTGNDEKLVNKTFDLSLNIVIAGQKLNNTLTFINDKEKEFYGRTPSNAKMLNFFYGNNPIEVLSNKKTSTLLDMERRKLATRTKQVKASMDSSKMKISLETFGNNTVKNSFYSKLGKITSTPKNLLKSMVPASSKYNRKKNVVGFDDKSHKFFYMG